MVKETPVVNPTTSMIRFFARIWAKTAYIFRLEAEAQTNLINAGLSAKRAAEKRAYIEQLEKESAAIEANIAREIESEEYKSLSGQEKYEADREKTDAEKVIEDKRAQAKQEVENVKGGEDAAKVFRSTPRTAAR
jgi:hypothetical protein